MTDDIGDLCSRCSANRAQKRVARAAPTEVHTKREATLDERLRNRCAILDEAAMKSHKEAYWTGYHDARNSLRSKP